MLQEGVLHEGGWEGLSLPLGSRVSGEGRVRAAHKASPVVSETFSSSCPCQQHPIQPEDWLGLPPNQGSDDPVCALFRLHSFPYHPPFDVAAITTPFARVLFFCFVLFGRGRAGVGKYTSKFTASGIVIRPRAVFCTSLMKGSNKTSLEWTLQWTH